MEPQGVPIPIGETNLPPGHDLYLKIDKEARKLIVRVERRFNQATIYNLARQLWTNNPVLNCEPLPFQYGVAEDGHIYWRMEPGWKIEIYFT